MAKRFVKISLATKFRLVFGAAVLIVIAAALVVPWYFTELLAEQSLQRPAELLTGLRLAEWEKYHAQPNTSREQAGDKSELADLYTRGDSKRIRKGPQMILLGPDAAPRSPLDMPAEQAWEAFRRNPEKNVAVLRTEDAKGNAVYRAFRAVRVTDSCLASGCHGPSAEDVNRQYQPGQFVAMVDATMPEAAAAGPLVWWTRATFIAGGVLAALVALIVLGVISQRLVLRPVRKLHEMTDKVAEGDMTARSKLKTGDELQRLGDSFNEMLTAITDQHEKLRAANRALDLKLHELSEANVALFQANQVKSEFLANVSHELRTPLNSIIGFADLLGEADDDRIGRYGRNIAVAAKNLLNMINDMLDLAKIEAGKAQVRLDKVSVTDTCQTLVALITPLAEKRNLAIDVQLDEDLPLIVTDGGKLQQILYNLLSNAVKFTPPGGTITLAGGTSSFQRKGREVAEAFVAVTDTGAGISEADQQHIFDKFYQSEKHLTKETPGTGLGLAISRELTTLLGGRLTIKSSPGQGATFTLFLPVDGPQRDEEENSKS